MVRTVADPHTAYAGASGDAGPDTAHRRKAHAFQCSRPVRAHAFPGANVIAVLDASVEHG